MMKKLKIMTHYPNSKDINISNYEIKVNGTVINLEDYLPNRNYKRNSFQLSFYDINKKYIVSKRIMKIKNANFSIFYGKYICDLKKFSEVLDMLCTDQTEFNNDLSIFYDRCLNTYTNIADELNLILPKKELENILNDEKYLYFIYFYIKIHLAYIFRKIKQKGIDNFNKLLKYLARFFEQLKKDKVYKIYEKISILFHFAELFNIVKECKVFLETTFHYIKLDKIEKNSVINLSLEFLNNYIDNLNEESPSYFKLLEINSGYGFYKGKTVFTYDMIEISTLKNHLKEIIPTVFCFYSSSNTVNYAFTYPTIIGICVNEYYLFQNNEKFTLDKNCFKERKYEVKNVAMKLALRTKHECFGHIKFRFHSVFCLKKESKTPKKCFDNKKLKELVGFNNAIKKNTVNILSDNTKSNSGHYFESSFGKLPHTKYYTFVYLKWLKNIGNLLDHPELFYKKENVEKLQKYAYYKYSYETKKENEKSDGEKEVNLNSLNFEQELGYLTDIFVNSSKSSDLNKIEESLDITTTEPKKTKKFLGKKRKLFKIPTSNKINEIRHIDVEKSKAKIKSRKKSKFPKIIDREKILDILRNKPMTSSKKQYYLDLFLETTHLV